MDKAQASVEFMMLSGVLLVILIVFSLFAFQKRVELQSEITIASGQQVADAIASHVNSAISLGDGYSEDFVAPISLENNAQYNVSWSGSDVVVAWSYDGTHEARSRLLRDAVLCGNVSTGALNNVRNSLGTIVFNNAAC